MGAGADVSRENPESSWRMPKVPHGCAAERWNRYEAGRQGPVEGASLGYPCLPIEPGKQRHVDGVCAWVSGVWLRA
ncbi:hypothetical protein VTO73DRAFT_9440 [Trametes versicolor]